MVKTCLGHRFGIGDRNAVILAQTAGLLASKKAGFRQKKPGMNDQNNHQRGISMRTGKGERQGTKGGIQYARTKKRNLREKTPQWG